MGTGRTITGDESGLLRGVLDSPRDLTAWGVYADFLDEHTDPRGPWLRAHIARSAAVSSNDDAGITGAEQELAELRPGIDPDWAALFDAITGWASHFTVLLTAEIADHLRETTPADAPLRELHSWATAQSDFRAGGVSPDAHIYPIQFVGGRIHILTRFRVATCRNRTKPFTDAEFLPRLNRELINLMRPEFIRIVDVADGGVLDFNRTVPRPVVERLRYATRRGERGLTFKKDGSLTSITGLHGVFRLAPGSARDLAAFVFDPALLDGLAPPTKPPGKKRK
jgi:uncharacterized protein (TIGR02996 family)